MSSLAVIPEPKRRWYALALRHLRMAARLQRSGFADGVVFHVYHAYECVLSALIASKGYPVPPNGWTTMETPEGKKVSYYPAPTSPITVGSAHKARIVFFDQLADKSKDYWYTHQRLRRILTDAHRMDALYYDAATDKLPHERYKLLDTDQIRKVVGQFAREVWHQIS